jgi:hypothetical protein
MIRCFKCEQPIKAAVVRANEEMMWTCPAGVQFCGGWNFGSSLYDAMLPGNPHVEIVICDKCIKKAQGSERIREVLPPIVKLN